MEGVSAYYIHLNESDFENKKEKSNLPKSLGNDASNENQSPRYNKSTENIVPKYRYYSSRFAYLILFLNGILGKIIFCNVGSKNYAISGYQCVYLIANIFCIVRMVQIFQIYFKSKSLLKKKASIKIPKNMLEQQRRLVGRGVSHAVLRVISNITPMVMHRGGSNLTQDNQGGGSGGSLMKKSPNKVAPENFEFKSAAEVNAGNLLIEMDRWERLQWNLFVYFTALLGITCATIYSVVYNISVGPNNGLIIPMTNFSGQSFHYNDYVQAIFIFIVEMNNTSGDASIRSAIREVAMNALRQTQMSLRNLNKTLKSEWKPRETLHYVVCLWGVSIWITVTSVFIAFIYPEIGIEVQLISGSVCLFLFFAITLVLFSYWNRREEVAACLNYLDGRRVMWFNRLVYFIEFLSLTFVACDTLYTGWAPSWFQTITNAVFNGASLDVDVLKFMFPKIPPVVITSCLVAFVMSLSILRSMSALTSLHPYLINYIILMSYLVYDIGIMGLTSLLIKRCLCFDESTGIESMFGQGYLLAMGPDFPCDRSYNHIAMVTLILWTCFQCMWAYGFIYVAFVRNKATLPRLWDQSEV